MPPALIRSVDHYENFPVASVLLPARLRPAVVAIACAMPISRTRRCACGRNGWPLSSAGPRAARRSRRSAGARAIAPFLEAHGLPAARCVRCSRPLRRTSVRCATRRGRATADYCSRSANPVGELVLQLFGARNPTQIPSGEIFKTALRLLNFLQDLAQDWRRDRLYLPLDNCTMRASRKTRSGAPVAQGSRRPALVQFTAGQTGRARALLRIGAALAQRVPWRLSLEVRAIVAGGLLHADRCAPAGTIRSHVAVSLRMATRRRSHGSGGARRSDARRILPGQGGTQRLEPQLPVPAAAASPQSPPCMRSAVKSTTPSTSPATW